MGLALCLRARYPFFVAASKEAQRKNHPVCFGRRRPLFPNTPHVLFAAVLGGTPEVPTPRAPATKQTRPALASGRGGGGQARCRQTSVCLSPLQNTTYIYIYICSGPPPLHDLPFCAICTNLHHLRAQINCMSQCIMFLLQSQTSQAGPCFVTSASPT